MADFKYEVVMDYASKDNLKVRSVSFNNREPKFDLRHWSEKDGNEVMGKGVTLTAEELFWLAKELPKIVASISGEADNNEEEETETEDEEDSPVQAEIRSPSTFKDVKVGYAQLNSAIDTLGNMFGKNLDTKDVTALKEKLNAYAAAPTDKNMAEIRLIANNLDEKFKGTTYTTKKSKVITFGDDPWGTFTDWAESNTDVLVTNSIITSVVVSDNAIDKSVNDLFLDYVVEKDEAEKVAEYKRSVNEVIKTKKIGNFPEKAIALSKAYEKKNKSVLKFRGKIDSVAFSVSDLVSIGSKVEAYTGSSNNNAEELAKYVLSQCERTALDGVYVEDGKSYIANQSMILCLNKVVKGKKTEVGEIVATKFKECEENLKNAKKLSLDKFKTAYEKIANSSKKATYSFGKDIKVVDAHFLGKAITYLGNNITVRYAEGIYLVKGSAGQALIIGVDKTRAKEGMAVEKKEQVA